MSDQRKQRPEISTAATNQRTLQEETKAGNFNNGNQPAHVAHAAAEFTASVASCAIHAASSARCATRAASCVAGFG